MSAFVHLVYYTGPDAGPRIESPVDWNVDWNVDWDVDALMARLAPARRERLARQASARQRALDLAALRLLEIGMRAAGEHSFRLADVHYPMTDGLSGKPHWIASRVDFSIAHTDGLAVCAITHDCRVGVDAEVARSVDPRTVARLLRAESALARDLDEHNAASRWTQIEAVLKGAGLGVMHGREIEWRGDSAVVRERRWRTHRIECGERHVMHVAVDAPDARLDVRCVTSIA